MRNSAPGTVRTYGQLRRDVSYREGKRTCGKEIDTLLWYREEYLVDLAKRRDYWLLKTAYCTTERGRIAKKRRERDAFFWPRPRKGQND